MTRDLILLQIFTCVSILAPLMYIYKMIVPRINRKELTCDTMEGNCAMSVTHPYNSTIFGCLRAAHTMLSLFRRYETRGALDQGHEENINIVGYSLDSFPVPSWRGFVGFF
jgi:hypothetical protein